MSDAPIFDPNDPSLVDTNFAAPGIDPNAIAQQVAQAMAGLGKRQAFDNLGADPMGRAVFDPSDPNAAARLERQAGVPPTQPEPAPTPQARSNDATVPAPEGVDEELWAQYLKEAGQPDDQSPNQPATQPQSEELPPPPPPAPPAQEPAEEQTYKVSIQGQEYTLSQGDVEYLLQVNSWLEQQPDSVKQQWAAIQAGESVAVSRAELERMQRATEFRQQSPAQQAQQLNNEPDLELLDEETAEYIRGLQQRLNQQASQDAPPIQPQAEQYTQPSVDPAAFQAAATRQAEAQVRNRAIVQATVDQYREQYDLTDEQADQLTKAVADSQMVPVLMNRYAVRSPLDNSVIQEAPFDRVVSEAFSMAMASDPTLKQVHEDYVFNQRLAATQAADQRVATKRGKAGSLAAAPSAAVPAGENQGLPPLGPGNQMNVPAMSALIADAIQQAQSGG